MKQLSAKATLRAQRAAIARRKEMLMLDHIEQAIGSVREQIAAMNDVTLLDTRSRMGGGIVENPFRCWAIKTRTPALAMIEAMYAFNLSAVIAGDLPIPEGPVYESCPNSACQTNLHGPQTFEWLREHTATCIPAAHARGIMVDDPWDRFVEGQHPTWKWTRGERAMAIIRRVWRIGGTRNTSWPVFNCPSFNRERHAVRTDRGTATLYGILVTEPVVTYAAPRQDPALLEPQLGLFAEAS